MRKFLALLAAIGVAITAPLSHAKLIDAKTPAAIATLVESRGWQTETVSEAGEPPYIKATRGGELYVIAFMNCTDGKNCKTLQLFMGFTDAKDVPLEKFNEWNRDRRFARAYRDEDGDPVLAMDIDLDFAGLPRENVGELFNTWTDSMESYRTFVGGE
ncbi:MAG TPA: YbjN domain-containing protein [Sphingopyxis sp.]|nr:YbjN domain-containing protein [Sphingopyxis sp.]